MKLNPYHLFLTTAFLAGCARAHVVPTPTEVPGTVLKKVPGTSVPIKIAPPSPTIPSEERLEYQISWWGVPVANAVLTAMPVAANDPVRQQAPLRDRRTKNLVKLTISARSNSYLEAFYPVRVELISLIDSDARSPLRFQAFVKRRWRVHESTVTFDLVKATAFHKLPKGRTATVAIQPTTQDGVSLLYYVRTIPFEVGQAVPLEVSADGKNWSLSGQILRTSIVELRKAGSWPAVEGQVQLAYPVPFFHGAKAHVWFSADGQRIPLLARIRSRIGPVAVVLTKFRR